MTLYDYIKKSTDWEITVWDDVYDVEVYFYKPDNYNNLDLWDKSMVELSKLLTITSFCSEAVMVNLSNIICKKIPQLSKTDLFNICELDEIIDEIHLILSGSVSDKWLSKFVNVLKEN